MGNSVSKPREALTFKNSQKCTYRFKKKKKNKKLYME